MAKFLQVRFSDGYWNVPAHIIADDRAKFYAKDDPSTTYEEEYDFTMGDHFELCDWAVNNMNWADVKGHAVYVKPIAVDYENEWLSVEKEVVEAAT